MSVPFLFQRNIGDGADGGGSPDVPPAGVAVPTTIVGCFGRRQPSRGPAPQRVLSGEMEVSKLLRHQL